MSGGSPDLAAAASSSVPVMDSGCCDDADITDGAAAGSSGALEERGPLRRGKVFVTDRERAAIRRNLETAHRALTEAWELWQERDRAQAWDYDYWDSDDVYGLESTALDALGGTEEVWKALTTITDAHEAQLTAAENTGQDWDDF